MLIKVPEITIYFWAIKILCTTVGETAADYMNWNLNLGLTSTTYIMGALLAIALFFQFKGRKYVPSVYWLAVVFLSIFGTLITDNLTDVFEVKLEITTIAFSIALAIIFAAWYKSEKTLSIHSIYTTRRETFYWLVIFFTFALGTAAGDLLSERFELGYVTSIGIFGALLGVIAVAHLKFKLNAVLAFWLAYILTRPFGASIGDYLSQLPQYGGLGFGTIISSVIFLVAILAMVIYLTVTKKDSPRLEAEMLENLSKTKKNREREEGEEGRLGRYR
ncbi:MAG: hypothetical protein R2685_09870 [Candidatus Nitrosocosmicus sp.]|nr:hypothetical protein [Candidatus Nitrosocosmicus sp.]